MQSEMTAVLTKRAYRSIDRRIVDI